MTVTVAGLLKAARDAHSRYRSAAGRISTKGTISHAPNLAACGEHARAALSARLDADALDPEHSDPAWLEDQALMRTTHEKLVDFYAAYLARDVAA